MAEDPGDEIALGTRVGVTQCMLMLARFSFFVDMQNTAMLIVLPYVKINSAIH